MPRCLVELLPSEIPAVVALMRTTRDHMKAGRNRKPELRRSFGYGFRFGGESHSPMEALGRPVAFCGIPPTSTEDGEQSTQAFEDIASKQESPQV